MKTLVCAFGILSASVWADLPVMSDKTAWLGYFAGWEGRAYDFGIGADGSSAMFPKNGRDQIATKKFAVQYFIEEEINGRWTRRKFAEDVGITSENEKGLNATKPVVIVTPFTGGTSVEWTHLLVRNEMKITPRILEKTTTNPIRAGVIIALPDLYRFAVGTEDKVIQGKVKGDSLTGIRKKDGKKVTLRFSNLKEDPNSEEAFLEGASAIEVKTDGIKAKVIEARIADKNSGEIMVETKGPLYRSFRLKWIAAPDPVGETENAFIFGMK